MNEKDAVIRELYSTLEKVHYPEVAQVPYENFETTILCEGTKRIDLLHWLLLESQDFNNVALTKSKDNSSLNDKIIKSYIHIGLCKDEKILLGQCPIDNQLQFLSLLANFVKAIHLPGNSLEKFDKDFKNDLLKADIISSDIGIKIVVDTVNETETKSNCKTESINVSKFLSNEKVSNENNTKETEWNVEESIESLKKLKTENYDSVIQKFNSCFEEIKTLQIKNSHDIFESCNDIATDFQQIHSAFSSIDKILVNEDKIKNLSTPNKSTTNLRSLTQAIKSNLVSTEQVLHMFSDYKTNNE